MSTAYIRRFIQALLLLVLSLIFISAMFMYPLGLKTGATSYLSPVFRLGALITIFIFAYQITEKKLERIPEWFKNALVFLALIIQIIFLLTFFRPVYTDTGIITTMVGRLIENNHHWFEYYDLYPNNVNITIFWATLLKPLRLLGVTSFQSWIHWIQMFLLDYGIFYLAKSFKMINQKFGTMFFYLALFYMPWFMYAIFPYNDLLAISIFMIIIGTIIKLFSIKKNEIRKKVVYSILIGILFAFAVTIRQNSVIILIAFVLTILFSQAIDKHLKSLLIVLVLFLTIMMTVGANQVAQHEGFKVNTNRETPAVRWINMSWNPNTSGEIDGTDSSIYDNLPKNERAKKLTLELKKRLKFLGIKGIFAHTIKKIAFMFSFGFSNQDFGFSNHDMEGLQINKPILQNYSQTTAFMNMLSNLFQPFYLLLLVFAGYGCWNILAQKFQMVRPFEILSLFSAFSIVGIFAFHIVLWEVRDRYVLPIIPFFLFLSAIGIYIFFEKRKKLDTKVLPLKTLKFYIPYLQIISVFLLIVSFIHGYSKTEKLISNTTNTYFSSYIFYNEHNKELIPLQPHSVYKTDVFELKSPTNNFSMFIGNLNQEQTNQLKLSILQVDQKKAWNIPVQSGQINLKNKFPEGRYRVIIENSSSKDITITALKQLQTQNIQGPAIQRNGKVVNGLNLAFDFNDTKITPVIPMLNYFFIYFSFFFLLAMSWFVKKGGSNYLKRGRNISIRKMNKNEEINI
ncbi:PMT family glycosyltransferase ArnT/Agl22 [Fructobacillus tropaeoli]|uniref:Involved in glycosylation of proteins and lipid IVA (ArnT) n=1 Tax=Fructobacillus tropaeoli TaxID=709323 RepID=A0ABN9YN04_9LACO|nr:PMT family glycosyltransferase ArnT/Agl22 [Fructobacillus tropaeoli]CAK1236325.1 PMT family glycosyltransferase ArnT/Agl22 [Fructobacillus tropaeoli]CAK1250305.1 PMT family glycosyltransferase ArnT/Agl22 [Fructobacillus tropaeoli]